MIKDNEYIAPPVKVLSEPCGYAAPPTSDDPIESENEKWGESTKENEEPIPVPSPGVLHDRQVRRSVRTFKLPGSKPYLLIPADFLGVPGLKCPVPCHCHSTYSQLHHVGKIVLGCCRAVDVGDGD